jgi:hypothetical protein
MEIFGRFLACSGVALLYAGDKTSIKRHLGVGWLYWRSGKFWASFTYRKFPDPNGFVVDLKYGLKPIKFAHFSCFCGWYYPKKRLKIPQN